MNSKDKHINKFLHDPLPEPEIPADEAWAGINGMLDASGGQGVNGSGGLSQVWKSITKFKGLVIVASTVATTSAIVALFVLVNQTDNRKITLNQSVISKNQGSDTLNNIPNSNTSAESQGAGLIKIPSKTTELQPDSNAVSVAGSTSETASEKVAGHIKSNNAARANNTESARTTPPGSPRVRTANAPVSARQAGIAQGAGVSASTPAKVDNTNSQRPAGQNTAVYAISRPANSLVTQQEFASFSTEKNSSNAAANNMDALPVKTSMNFLQPRAGQFASAENNLSRFVKKPVLNAAQPSPKTRKPIFKDLHFGPEWNINRSLVSTDYMFTGADSVKHAARLAIPGLFVSKSWNRHSVTFIFNPLHTYFGDKERVAQKIDTAYVSDSVIHFIKRNTNFIKAFGINFGLQYQFRATSWLSLMSGVSYARYSAALLRKENEYSTGWFINDSYLAARGKESLKSYIHPQQWNIRAGILLHSPTVFNNRLQLGMNILIPVSNLSLNGFKRVKSPNSQVSLRFLIK